MKLDRRFLLRGAFQGAVAVMGMPFLDCFLDNKGQALAATGAPLAWVSRAMASTGAPSA